MAVSPCLSAPLYLHLGGCEPIDPALGDLRPQPGVALPHALAQALGPVAFPWSPRPVPGPTPLTPEPEPTHGAPLAACPIPAMGTARISGSWRRAAQLGSLRVPPLVSASRSPGPFGSTAQLSGPHSVPSLLAGLAFPPQSPRSWFSTQARHLVSVGRTLALGCAQPLLQATLVLDCARPPAGLVQLQVRCRGGGGQVGRL